MKFGLFGGATVGGAVQQNTALLGGTLYTNLSGQTFPHLLGGVPGVAGAGSHVGSRSSTRFQPMGTVTPSAWARQSRMP